ncbi:MAG TPA: hypothetical protein VFJ82_06670 [Longimicrobium sp.]|nr:hypothetical protein [Longimicrobium sp.]
MKKLTLDLEGLTVDSFATVQPADENGTVEAFSEGWSDTSVCPTTTPSDCRACRPYPR